MASMSSSPRPDRLHGRTPRDGRCEWQGCAASGEFRAPGERAAGFDGPGEYRWLCLEHVRAFNDSYNYFAGMTPDEIAQAQSPLAGWASETRAFRATAGIDETPRWADFADPLDAISARARLRRQAAPAGRRFSRDEARALEVLGLGGEADRRELRARYSALVRRYHPDHNGGDRSHEARLRAVVEAYDLLRKAAAFA